MASKELKDAAYRVWSGIAADTLAAIAHEDENDQGDCAAELLAASLSLELVGTELAEYNALTGAKKAALALETVTS